MQALPTDFDALSMERKQQAEELTVKHGMKLKEVCHHILIASDFKTKRKVNLYNTKISKIMANLNGDRETGDRYKIPEVKRMVVEDLSMLEGFTLEEEQKMMTVLQEKCKQKYQGTRANNLAAGVDARCTVECMMVELQITSLVERAGMMDFAMFTHGHIHDTMVPVMIQSWGPLDFFRDVLKRDPADVSVMFELWAIA
ncbi:hypothetical protein DFH09DRAFT_1097834 [Mycena vulgaris]|nr:hypothetical protein DFH09DRAFT_1097834 [Mycena vulgaris]